MKKIAFVHGRPKGHPVHAEYANSVNSDFYHEDIYLRWHDNPNAPKIKRYLSWLINAFFFPSRKSYDIFLTECIRIPQLFMKKFGLIGKNQKLVALMGDESLYFLSINKYPLLTRIIMRSFLNSCDLLICTSKLQAKLASSIVSSKSVQIRSIFNGLESDKYKAISLPQLEKKKIVFLGNIEETWRSWYKGADLLIEAFEHYAIKNTSTELFIYGSISGDVKKRLLSLVQNKSIIDRIKFEGNVPELSSVLHNYDLVVHPSRGEAWGVTVHIALACGIPSIVSIATGTKEIVQRIDPNLIVDLNARTICSKIEWYFKLSKSEKQKLSSKSRKVALTYTSTLAENAFKEALLQV